MALIVPITVIASLGGKGLPVVGAPVFAILVGIAVALVWTPTETFKPGIAFASKQILQGSIVVLGLGLSMHQVLAAGVGSLPVLIGTLAIAFAMAWVVSRALGVGRDLSTLIGVGTGICGASAIAAVDAVIDAKKSDVSYAITTIFIFNVVAVLLFPPIGHLLDLSQQAFGLWAGTAINDTSSVVAASAVYGHDATTEAVVVKLTRTLAIIPVCLFLSWAVERRLTFSDRATDPPRGFSARRTFPLFIVAFLAAVAINSIGLVPADWHPSLAQVATWMITAALAAIGLSTSLQMMRRAGVRPIVLGAILWVTVAVSSLGLQLLTGTL